MQDMDPTDLIPTLTALTSIAALITWLRHLTANDRHHTHRINHKD